jgi:hypothetical protein
MTCKSAFLNIHVGLLNSNELMSHDQVSGQHYFLAILTSSNSCDGDWFTLLPISRLSDIPAWKK